MQICLKPLRLTALAFALAVSAPALAQEQSPPPLDTVLATVNGTEITLGHVAAAKATLPEQYQQVPADVLFPAIINQLIQQTALRQSLDGDMPQRVALALENEERSLLAGEAIERVMAEAVTEEALRALFEEEYAEKDMGVEYNASHILLESEEDAVAVRQLLEDGADFAETAREKSTGPSGPSGGNLGWFGEGMMVPEFEQAVVALQEGEVSQPVQTQFGWHVIALHQIRQKNAPALEEVRAELEQQLRNLAVEAHIEELTAAAEIDRTAGEEMDPAVLDQINLLELP